MNLEGCDFTGVDLRGANLTDTYLAGANIGGIDLSTATLTRVRAYRLRGPVPKLPTDWSLVDASFGDN